MSDEAGILFVRQDEAGLSCSMGGWQAALQQVEAQTLNPAYKIHVFFFNI